MMGVFHTVRATLPSVIDRRGYVLIVSSLAAYASTPGQAPYNAAKAAVEQFANAVRLEVGYRGVEVGSAHMSWIDTPLFRDTKADLSVFAEMLTGLPFPLNKKTSVEACEGGLRLRHREPQTTSELSGLGRCAPMAQTAPVHAGR